MKIMCWSHRWGLAQPRPLTQTPRSIPAAPGERGRVVGTVMTGLLPGGLPARTAAGTVSELGCAAGPPLASLAWTHAGRSGVSLLGGTLSAAALTLWALERLQTRRPGQRGGRAAPEASRSW